MNSEPLLLGIDGGGTKTTARLALSGASGTMQVLATGRGGPSNPSVINFSQAMAAIDHAVAQAFAAAGRPRQQAAAACLSVAGGDRETVSRRILEWAVAERIAELVSVTNDAAPILVMLPEGRGVALIAGTGSFAVGRGRDGRLVKVGGWGYRFGDEGSGYALATEALRAAALAADGRGPRTALLDRCMEHFGAAQPRALTEKVYAPGIDRTMLANAAPLVLAAAADGDAVAQRIAGRAAAQLAELVLAVAERLTFAQDRPLPLAVAGGVLVNSAPMRGQVWDRLAERGLSTELTIVTDPADGALRLAQETLAESRP